MATNKKIFGLSPILFYSGLGVGAYLIYKSKNSTVINANKTNTTNTSTTDSSTGTGTVAKKKTVIEKGKEVLDGVAGSIFKIFQ